MQILISCAKTMTGTAAVAAPRTTRPLFETEAAGLALRLAALPAGELERMLRVNPRIAAENRRRYLAFHDAPQLPAIAAYTGVVFRHIAPAEFSPADFAYAQEHLSITSFLYGLLRPLDAIRPYRLEGSVAPPGEEAPNLFEWWRDRLTGPLIERVRRDDGVLVNLASAEMKRLFDWQRVCREMRVVTPEFRIREGDRMKTVVVYAKMCRGEMTRHILRHRIADPEGLKTFEWEGFRFDPERSRGDEPHFTLR